MLPIDGGKFAAQFLISACDNRLKLFPNLVQFSQNLSGGPIPKPPLKTRIEEVISQAERFSN